MTAPVMPSSSRHDDPYSRSSQSRAPEVNTTRRTWGNNNGFQFTVETTSFSSPGRSFTTPSGSGNTSRNTFASAQPPRSAGANMLGTAFNLFADYAALRQQRQEQRTGQARTQQSGRRSSRRPYVEDEYDADDGFAFEQDSGRNTRPRSLFAKFAESYADNAKNARDAPRRGEMYKNTEAPRERRKRNEKRKQRKPRDDRTRDEWPGRFEPRSKYSTEEENSDYADSEEDDSDDFRNPQPRRSSTTNNAAIIEALEKAAEHHREQIRLCKTRYQMASKLPNANLAELQRLLNEVKGHENAYETVKRDLNDLKADNPTQRSDSQPSRPSTSRRSSARTVPDPLFDPFGFGEFEAFFGPRRSSAQGFADFGNLHNFSTFGTGPFAAFDAIFNDPIFGPKPSFGMPRATFTSSSRAGSGFPAFESTSRQFPPPPNPLKPFIFVPPPKSQPPATLLQPQEAKALFQTYNERWNALAPTDPNIPYPCRSLQARALNARDSLWAPNLRASIATWSEEAVMQANAQAFFLGVVGLAPTYTEALGTGTIVRGFDKARATAAQKQQLVEVLKKEKTRWHSDRLGRRNGGGVDAGVNEALQRDERARAVFHAVCELMEFSTQ